MISAAELLTDELYVQRRAQLNIYPVCVSFEQTILNQYEERISLARAYRRGY
jgi:predicted GNAT family acetyltransferase